MSESIIKDRPKISGKKAIDEYTPDPSRACDFMELSRISDTESELIHCKNLADYRVKLYGNRKYLIEGGDPSKATDYKSLVEAEYLCEKHFTIKHKYPSPPTPKLSYLKIKR